MSCAGAQEESLESHVKELVLKREIGKGSYGKVYKAVWKGRDVAAKRFHSVFFQNSSCLQEHYMEEFQREWNVLKLLHHPNVVKLHTVLFPKGLSPIIITELLHCDLEKYIRESTTTPKIPEMKLICIALDVIEGLNYMHGLERPVAHRDLATKNILLTEHGNAKVADLGVAKIFEAGCEMHATHVPGTPLYTAPETYPVMKQFEVVGNARYGPKVDIFSFGAVVMAMIVGHEPSVWPLTPITKDGEMISEHVRRKTDITEMGEHFLKKLVLGCLENDSTLRPDIKDIKEELERHKWKVVKRSSLYEADEEVQIEKVGRQPSYDYKLKVLFIGDTGVGKSCLFNRFKNPFFNIFLSTTTTGIEIDRESFKYGSKFVRLEVVDTAGQEQFFSLQAMYFRGVHGIFLVCDVTNRESFDHIPRWLNLAKTYCTESNALIIIIGNKTDQAEEQVVSSEEGQDIAKSNGLSYMEASALDVNTIEEMFKTMINLLTRSVDLGSIKIELSDASGKVNLKPMTKKSKCKCSRK
ncbi:hypothetical protein ABFA07_009964 [Porites harrisoni]